MRRIDTRWLIIGGLVLAAFALNSQHLDLAALAATLGNAAFRFALLFPAIILHEVAHGYVAFLLGDDTAKRMGRLTLNPVKHIDPIGTIVLPMALLILSGGRFFFGYAKPVPFNPRNFKDERTGMLLTGIAGPVTNIVLAVIVGLAVRFFPATGPAWFETVYSLLYFFAYANLVLAFFNLVPVPPLDGSRVLQWFLPNSLRDAYHSLERYGFLALIALTWIIPGLFNSYIALTVEPVFSAITGIR
jgi:Zn-dependent protease